MAKYASLLDYLSIQRDQKAILQKRSIEALTWYRQKVHTFFGAQRLNLDSPVTMKELGNMAPVKGIYIGRIYSFKYTPKLKATLPYYDRFPLVLIIKIVPGGFIGLNFHYINPIDRAIFMDRLFDLEVPDSRNKTMRINISYNLLTQSNRLRYYKACIKRYRYHNIGNFFVPIQPQEWELALFLPTDHFMKETRKTVWDLSRSKY